MNDRSHGIPHLGLLSTPRRRRQFAVALVLAGLMWAQADPDAVARWQANRGLHPGMVVMARHVPARPPGATGGADFARRIADMSGAERERETTREILRGNLPEFLRALQPVTLSLGEGESAVEATLWVMPDYLAVGTDADFLRMPMSLDTAATIARAFDMTLPTRPMVDAIYAAATVHLPPAPMPPTSEMTSTAYFVAHNQTIERQRARYTLGTLTAGQKKDLVLTSRLMRVPGRVAIYGWHRPDGNPIQPLSTVHGAAYADYSHGVRLVSRVALVDGRQVDVFSILRDPRRAGLFSREGAISDPERILDEVSHR